jgi:uncharacterized repeat protein (TIGR03803 family)
MKSYQTRMTFLVLVLALCALTATSSPAQTVTTLADFSNNGYSPTGDLVQGFNGEFYGVTLYGPSSTGVGTVYDVTSSGTLSVLNKFQSYYGQNWLGYQGGLTLATNGNFYGSAPQGGTYGYGAIYQATSRGKLTALYNFCSQINSQGDCADGGDPSSGVIQAFNGNLYGTAYDGGAGTSNSGTIFALTLAGKLTTLYTFCTQTACLDGQNPVGLLQAQNQNFYGITSSGGLNGPYGTVFKMNGTGVLTTLYSFCSSKSVVNHDTECKDGNAPGTLVQGTDGNFYGTTLYGGNYTSSGCAYSGCGTIFKITPAGKLTTLHTFDGSDGDVPNSLVQATDGNLYGTANLQLGGGTIFQITPEGQFTLLYTFPSFNGPSGLMQATDGNFYGTTVSGGSTTCDCGTVFSLSMGLSPFVESVPGAANVGRKITILGNNLTGTTSVSFNGTAATFTVVSDTEIKAAVPTGATSGTVEVVTPSGTLASNLKFHVLP